MKMRLRIAPRAATEIEDAAKWYEAKRDGLGDQFLSEVDYALMSILGFPEIAPKKLKNIRRAVLRRFPHSVFYIVREDAVNVLAVIHQADNPKKWPKR